MRLFIIYFNTSVWFIHRTLKKLTLSDKDKNMGDNIGKVKYQTLPCNATPLISLYHALDPDHRVVQGFQCTCILLLWHKKRKTFCINTFISLFKKSHMNSGIPMSTSVQLRTQNTTYLHVTMIYTKYILNANVQKGLSWIYRKFHR